MFNWGYGEDPDLKLKCKFFNCQKCKKCGYVSKTSFFMRNHLECHSSTETFNCANKDLPIYQCKKNCNFKTNLIVFLKQHLKDFHKMRFKDYETSKPDYKIQNYVCQKCAFESYSLLQLFKHAKQGCQEPQEVPTRQHPLSQIKWHKCDQCSFKTKRKCYLKTHSTLRHQTDQDVKLFQCSQCNFQTKWKIGLRKHCLYKHTAPDAVKWYYCDQCSYKAKTNYDLTDHRMWKHMSPEEVTWFHCTQCPYRAKKKSKLKQHENTQHVDEKDIKWMECDECGFKTKAKSNLRAHKLGRHTASEDIKWFECNQCPYKGRYRRKLEQHVLARHNVSIFAKQK